MGTPKGKRYSSCVISFSKCGITVCNTSERRILKCDHQ